MSQKKRHSESLEILETAKKIEEIQSEWAGNFYSDCLIFLLNFISFSLGFYDKFNFPKRKANNVAGNFF